MKLYEIVGQFKAVYDMIDEDTDAKVLQDTIEAIGLMDDLNEKADGYVKLIKQLMAEGKAFEAEAKAFEKKATARYNLATSLIKRLYDAMLQMGITEIPNKLFKIKIRKNGGVAPLVFVEGKYVPEEYKKVTVENDNSKIREAIKAGKKLDFVTLGERGTHLEIK